MHVVGVGGRHKEKERERVRVTECVRSDDLDGIRLRGSGGGVWR